MKKIFLLLITALFAGCTEVNTSNEHIQESIENVYPVSRTNKNSTVKVSKNELIFLIQKGTALASEKEIEQFSNDEHILVIMLLNIESLYLPEEDKELNYEYEKFSSALKKLKYSRKVGNHLKWQPNTGMGMYFPDLDIHFGGGITSGWSFLELKE